MIIGVPAPWWIKQPLRSSTGIGRAQPCSATQYAARSMTTTLAPYEVRTRRIVRRAYPIVLRIIPIRAPFTHLTSQASYPTPTHICWILPCWSWAFDWAIWCASQDAGGYRPSGPDPPPVNHARQEACVCKVKSAISSAQRHFPGSQVLPYGRRKP